jgi:hypothetical protein
MLFGSYMDLVLYLKAKISYQNALSSVSMITMLFPVKIKCGLFGLTEINQFVCGINANSGAYIF